MATYSESTFNTDHYNNARPNYPHSFYETLLEYHQGERNVAVDVGCGSGFVAFKLADSFKEVIGTDISPVMISQCEGNKRANTSFKVCPAEQLEIDNESVDLVASAEALHWVDNNKFFPEAYRALKSGGTLSYWFYLEPIFTFPKANELYDEFAFGPNHLGPYWEQPGKNRLRNWLRDDDPLKFGFVDVVRNEFNPYEPTPTTLKISKTIDLTDMKSYLTSWSAYHSWKKDSANDDKVDIVDQLIKDLHPVVGDGKFTVTWGTVYTLARKP